MNSGIYSAPINDRRASLQHPYLGLKLHRNTHEYIRQNGGRNFIPCIGNIKNGLEVDPPSLFFYAWFNM